MKEHLPALQIVIPLLAAPIAVILRHPVIVRLIAIAVAFTSLFISCTMLGIVMTEGPMSYYMGGWELAGDVPLGIELRVDKINAFIMLIISAIASVVMPYGMGQKGLAGPEGKEHLFYAAFMLAMTGLLGISITGDAFNVFVFLEVTSLSSYALVAMGDGRQAPKAAFNYLVMGTIGAFILLGVGFLLALTGTLNMADIAKQLPAVVYTPASLPLGSSSSVQPSSWRCSRYQWLPNAYTYAPSFRLSVGHGDQGVLCFLRTIFTLFGAAFVFRDLGIHVVLLPLSVVAMFVGSIAAIYQTNVKRLLAFSSVAQIGYMTLGLSLVSINGLTGGIVHLFNHALMKCGLFLAVGCVVLKVGSSHISIFRVS